MKKTALPIITTTVARERLAELITAVRYGNRPVAIGRRHKAEVLLVKFPDQANQLVDSITNMNQYGGAFDWLAEEPDLYSAADLKVPYVSKS